MHDEQPKTIAHILLIEDDELLVELLEKYLSGSGYAVTTLSAGEQLENLFNLSSFDVVVLDIMLPGKDGFTWLSWLQKHFPSIPVVLCSQCEHPDDRVKGLGLGARDYVIKPFHPKELLIRLGNLLKSHRVAEPLCFLIGSHQLDVEHSQLLLDDGQGGMVQMGLTKQENLLLGLMCRRKGQYVSRDDIAEALYSNSYDPRKRNIDMHITRLRRKLAQSGDTQQYLYTVRGKGYCLNLAG
jgi:DNA-binding response OmpR family regulator